LKKIDGISEKNERKGTSVRFYSCPNLDTKTHGAKKPLVYCIDTKVQWRPDLPQPPPKHDTPPAGTGILSPSSRSRLSCHTKPVGFAESWRVGVVCSRGLLVRIVSEGTFAINFHDRGLWWTSNLWPLARYRPNKQCRSSPDTGLFLLEGCTNAIFA
jgi:hypothetical protein